MPVTVQDWVGGRLRRLPAPVADALWTAALLGPHFPLRQLAGALGEPAAATLETLQRAVDSGILVVTPEDSDHYAFLHAIVAEAIVARTPHAERVRRHARIAEALVALTGHEAVDAVSVVRHLLPARPLLGDETLSLYSIRAGHEALATYSYRDARNHLAKGLAEGQHFLSDDERASAQFALARADSALENWDEVRIQLQTVFDYYVSAGRGEEAATAASFPMSVMTCATDIYQFCHGLVDDAKQLVDKASLAAGRLACWEAACVHWTSGDLGVCRDRLDVARRLAGRHGDRPLELRSTYYRGFIEKMGGNYVAGSALSAQAAQLARDMGDVHLEILSRASAAYSAAHLGRDRDRDEHEERALALLQRATDPRVARQTVFLAKPHWGAGRVDRARQLSDAGLTLAPHEAFLVWDRAKREADFAPRQVSCEWLERLRGALRVAEVGLGLPAIIRLAYRLDRADMLEWCRKAASRVSGERGLMCQCLLAFVGRDRRRARRLLREVGDGTGREWLLATVGDAASLRASFAARDWPEEPVERAREATQRAELLIGSGAEDAAEALAARLANAHGMVGLAAYVSRLRTSGAGRQSSNGALTARELDVLRGVADGLSDKEVAASLGIAKNTASNHVANILRKLGAPSRVAAARIAHVDGLLD